MDFLGQIYLGRAEQLSDYCDYILYILWEPHLIGTNCTFYYTNIHFPTFYRN